MRKLRTIITMLLVLTMAFSSFGVFAEESSVTSSVEANAMFSDIEAGSKVEQAVTKLVAHNIISGYPDGTFRPNGEITRGEFAAVITRFKGIADNLAADAVTGFSDLDNDTQNAWARPYVKAAVDAKIINGFDDGTFRAGEPVTYEQAVKMIICALGYEIVAQSEYAKLQAINAAGLTWSSGYIAAANKNNITIGAMTANVTAPATRGTVGILTSNALDAPELKVNDDGSYEKVEQEEEEKKLIELKGTVSGTYYTGLASDNVDVDLNELMITTTEETKTYTISSSLASSIDFEDIIGKYVVAYYDTQERIITSITPRNNTSVVVNEIDVLRPISGTSIKYYNDNGRQDAFDLANYTVLYNGKYVSSVAGLDTSFRNGQIEFIDSPNSKVAKITSYEVFVVNNFDKTNEKIYFRYGKTFDNGDGVPVNYYQFPSATSRKPIIYVNGAKKEFSSLSLSSYNVINYMESPRSAGGNSIKKMYVTTGSKTGTVTASDDTDRLVYLNDEEFYLTNDYNDYAVTTGDDAKAPFEIGDSYPYYFDVTGQIAAIKYNSASQGTYKFGYLVAAGENNNKEDVVRIVSADNGTMTEYVLPSNIKIDGTNVKDSEVADTLAIIAGNITNSYAATTMAQPIRFSVSGSTLKAIDTLSVGTGDEFSKTINGDVDSTVSKSSIKQGSVTCSMLSSTTKVLYVPDNVTDTKSYAKLSLDAAFRVAGSKRVEAFNVGSDKVAPFVIVYGSANPSHVFVATSPYMIVSKVSHSGDTMNITGYKNAATTESTITVDSANYKSAIPGATANYEDVAKGDLIRYIENNGNVVAIEIWYDADSPLQSADYVSDSNPLRKENKQVSGDSNSRYFRYGMIYAASDETKLMALSKYIPSDSVSSSEKADSTNAMYFKCNSAKIYELDSNGNVSVLESFASLNSYNETSNTASIAIMITPYDAAESAANIVYVVKN